VAGRDREAAVEAERGGQLGRGPDPVGHHVADRADRSVRVVRGDAHVLLGDLRHRVDPVLAAAPPHLGPDAVLIDRPLAAGPRDRREVVGGVRELGDVEPAGPQVRRHGCEVGEQVVEGEEVAVRVQHGDGEIEAVRELEVPHVRLDHAEVKPGGLGPRRREGAHRGGLVERRGAQPAAAEFKGVLGGTGGELKDRVDLIS
jgi:hypothetical protein